MSTGEHIKSAPVWARGARTFTWMAKMANRSTWIVAPAAYQKGPDTPYCKHSTLLLRDMAVRARDLACRAHACQMAVMSTQSAFTPASRQLQMTACASDTCE